MVSDLTNFFFITDNWACLKLLLEYGADLDKNDLHFGTPLHVAAYKGINEVIHNLNCLFGFERFQNIVPPCCFEVLGMKIRLN